MIASELVYLFRSEVGDTYPTYNWSDDEVLIYLSDAYAMFFRLIGGIADFLSEACEVFIILVVELVDLHPSILRIMGVTRRSDTRPVDVINSTDVAGMRTTDYGLVKQLILDDTPGEVRYLVHGMQRGKARLVQVPTYDDYLALHIYRLPLITTLSALDELVDMAGYDQLHLLDWMKHLAFKKNDPVTFDPKVSEMCAQNFRAHCSQVKAEFERYKHKPRSVTYGGL